MEIFSLIAVGAGVACWFSAVAHWLALFGHRAPGVTAARLIFSGFSAFSSASFRPSGHPIQRRMLLSFLGFFVFAVGGAALGSTSAARTKPAPVVATSGSPGLAPSPADPEDGACMSAKLSMDRAKPHRNAGPPFADCAAGVFSHCDGGDGERGGLCSRPLDAPATRAARTKSPDACCY